MRTERKEWKADDYNAVIGMFPEEPCIDDVQVRTAKFFGYEVIDKMPVGEGYWALEPRCVVRPWFRRPGEETWLCLTCCGAFDSQIRDHFEKSVLPK